MRRMGPQSFSCPELTDLGGLLLRTAIGFCIDQSNRIDIHIDQIDADQISDGPASGSP